MRIVELTLVTRDVEPGWPLMADDVPLGKRYLVDLDHISAMRIENPSLGRVKKVACVWVVSPGPPGYLPAMAFGLLDLPDDIPSEQLKERALSKDHVAGVCRYYAGSACCSFLGLHSSIGHFCMKQTPLEQTIRMRRADGTMVSMGDNCSGPPDYKIS